jgi:putative transposase
MRRTYQFKLEPTAEQVEKIEQTLHLCRWLYNSMLEQRKLAYKLWGISFTFYTQKKELPKVKEEFPEFKQVYSQVLQDVCQRLDQAFQAFFRRVKKGEKAGYPRFQGKNRYDSFTYPQSGFKLEGKYLTLSKIGTIRMKLHRQMDGKIKTCTIKRKNGKYYACFACEMEPKPQMTGRQVGVDLGVKHLAITSDGEFFEHPKYLRKAKKRLKSLQRMVSRRKKAPIAGIKRSLCSQNAMNL